MKSLNRAHLPSALALLALSLVMSAPTTARADSPLQTFTQGGPGAHGASTSTVGAIFYNPAAIAALDHNQVHADVALSWRYARYERAPQGSDTSSDAARMLSLDYQPNLAFSRELGDTGLVVGVGIERDLLDRSHWLDEGGEQRWHSIYSGARTWTLSPTLAYRLSEKLSLGASAKLRRVHVYGYRALDYGPIAATRLDRDDVPEQAAGNEGRAHMDFKGNAGGWSLGATLTPTPKTRLGLSYISAAAVQIDGEVSVYAPRNETFTRDYGDQEAASATLSMVLPRALDLAAQHELSERLMLFGDLRLVQGSQLDAIEIDVAGEALGNIPSPDRRLETGFENFGRLRLGAVSGARSGTQWLALLGYASRPMPEEHLSPAWIYGRSVEATLGARFALSPKRRLGLSYTQRVMLPREVTRSALQPAALGSYQHYTGFLSVSFDWEILSRTVDLPEVQPAPRGATQPMIDRPEPLR